VNRILSAQ